MEHAVLQKVLRLVSSLFRHHHFLNTPNVGVCMSVCLSAYIYIYIINNNKNKFKWKMLNAFIIK